MKKYLILLALICAPTVSFAQTHPCDIDTPTDFRVRRIDVNNVVFGWCAAALDDEGNPVTLMGFRLRLETESSLDVRDLGAVPALTGANAEGFRYYESTQAIIRLTIASVMTYALEGESPYSIPITIRVTGSPKAPKGVRVVGGM